MVRDMYMSFIGIDTGSGTYITDAGGVSGLIEGDTSTSESILRIMLFICIHSSAVHPY